MTGAAEVGATALAFVANLGATLAMAGVIWIVQVVHYPLFSGVGEEGFAAYASSHARRITFVVGPLMLVEAATAVWLAFDRPAPVGRAGAWAGVALVAVAWASTFFVQVPLHGRLGAGFDAAAHARLVRTNWARTAAWTARAALVLWWAARAVR